MHTKKAKNTQKYIFLHFFLINIWSFQKKAVILHPGMRNEPFLSLEKQKIASLAQSVRASDC